MSPVAIVTASDSGIGQESAKELAENGFDIGITYRTDEAGPRRRLRPCGPRAERASCEGWTSPIYQERRR